MISLKSDEITNDLIRQILSGELAISSNLPSENQLAIKYKCNRHTIRKVINHLIERNYLIKTCDRVTYILDLCINLRKFTIGFLLIFYQYNFK